MSIMARLSNTFPWGGANDSVGTSGSNMTTTIARSSSNHVAVPSSDEDDETNMSSREDTAIIVSSVNEDGDDDDDEYSSHDEDDDIEAAPVLRSRAIPSTGATSNSTESRRSVTTAPSQTATLSANPNLMSVRALEEERELSRRRTSVCLLVGVFLLFRLWIEALTQGDFGLLMLCLVGTSWCARYIRHNRDQEEELDRRIAAFQNANNNNNNGNHHETASDLRMLSFQAQLALAIMESQRQMMQGGYGHPDGNNGAASGVSEETRSQWERFEFHGPCTTVTKDEKNIKHSREYSKVDDEEEPTCTICLGEYESGESLVKLPCRHIYHDECLTAWTAEHNKCPLCNMDLEVTTNATTTEDGV